VPLPVDANALSPVTQLAPAHHRLAQQKRGERFFMTSDQALASRLALRPEEAPRTFHLVHAGVPRVGDRRYMSMVIFGGSGAGWTVGGAMCG